MKQLLLAIIALSLFVGMGIAQETNIDNRVWQTIEQDDYRFRLPPDWTYDSDSWQAPDDPSTISLLIVDADSIAILENASIIFEETITLPIGASSRIVAESVDTQFIAYIVNHPSQTIALIGQYSPDLSEDEQAAFLKIHEQAANTLQPIETNDETWSLYANTNANLFLRIPDNWMRESSDIDSLTVRETFDDVSITIRYRDLGRSFELAEIEEQFVDIYNANAYDIQAQDIVNLPSGAALFFRLGNVSVTAEIVHTQLHYIVARENYMIVIVAGGNESYFEDYEPVLRQIVDTITFNAP